MFSIFKKKEPPLLLVTLNNKELCNIGQNELPSEKDPSA
jgi:hypothetical protein